MIKLLYIATTASLILLTSIVPAQEIFPDNIESKLSSPTGVNFRKAPYVIFPGRNTSMIILWQLDDTKSCLFEWGQDSINMDKNISNTELNNEHQHQIKLSNLEVNTLYYYKITVDGTIKKGSFKTGASYDEESISFYAYGDTRNHPKEHNNVAKQILNYIADDPASQTFVLTTGDFVDNGDKESAWDKQFFNNKYKHIQKLLANLCYAAALGNHEKQGLLFAKYFPYPMFKNGRYYYAFNNGPAHIAVLDQYTNYNIGSPQYNWLVNDLSSTEKQWKILVIHEPGWSAKYNPNNIDIQNIIQPLCEQYGVQIVFAGHNHYYARASVNEVQHITTAGGGAPLYNPKPGSPNVVKTDKSYHFCKVEIVQNSLHFTAVRADGSIIESFDLYNGNASSNSTSSLDKEFQVFSTGKNIRVLNNKNLRFEVEIYNISGQRILQKTSNNYETQLSISKSGIYFVRIILKNGFFVKKVIL